jgi:transcriptional regulator with XRE-family HTH domain
MPAASTSCLGEGLSMPALSQIVTCGATPKFHNLCGERNITECDTALMDSDKNGGPNYLARWREFRGRMTQQQLADKVGTNANMIGYLESGDRGLNAKWLRRLADALDTTPGMILEHDPFDLDADVVDIWVHGDARTRKQIAEIARTLVKTGTNG